MRVTPTVLRPWRSSIRARIVIACAGLFLVLGAILIGAAYTQVGQVLMIPSGPHEVIKPGHNPQISATTDTSKRRGFLVFTLAGLGLGTVLAAGLGWAVSRRVLRPLAAVTTAAQAASQENLNRRLALAGPPDELKELADTFDAMLARLEAAFASQRRFVANASHELRTPLTEMRTLIDVTIARPAASPEQLQPVLGAIGAAVDKSEELIEALLTLARSDRGPGPAELVDLPTAVEDAIDSIGPAAAARQIHIRTALQDAQVTGDRVLLERLVSNLIDNAVKHNVTGGWVLASTRTETGTAELTVANGGEHIPPGQVTGLFEPFRRLCGRIGNRPGTGLGLSIVASVAHAHGGHAQAHARPDGGLDVQITLPATVNGHTPAPHQPHTNAAQIWQPVHRLPPLQTRVTRQPDKSPSGASPATSSPAGCPQLRDRRLASDGINRTAVPLRGMSAPGGEPTDSALCAVRPSGSASAACSPSASVP